MPAEEVVRDIDPTTVVRGHPYIEVFGATVAPVDERPLVQRSMEFRLTVDPMRCYVQVGPMRYEVDANALVEAVNRTFPYAAKNVKDSYLGKFEVVTAPEAVGEAMRRGFHTLHRLSGMLPRRITGALDVIADATGVSAVLIAEKLEVFGCEVVVDAMSENIVIDYGAYGFPFSVTVKIVADPGDAA